VLGYGYVSKTCETALPELIPFATTYLCESGFSTLLSIKTKSRNRLKAQADMRVGSSNIVPPWEKLFKQETGTKESLN